MSETRTGLRNRIWHTMRQSRDRHPDIRNSLGAEIDAGEAVYAQALHDVLDLMQEREIEVGGFLITVPVVTDDDLLTFAADKGIDLNGGE